MQRNEYFLFPPNIQPNKCVFLHIFLLFVHGHALERLEITANKGKIIPKNHSFFVFFSWLSFCPLCGDERDCWRGKENLLFPLSKV